MVERLGRRVPHRIRLGAERLDTDSQAQLDRVEAGRSGEELRRELPHQREERAARLGLVRRHGPRGLVVDVAEAGADRARRVDLRERFDAREPHEALLHLGRTRRTARLPGESDAAGESIESALRLCADVRESEKGRGDAAARGAVTLHGERVLRLDGDTHVETVVHAVGVRLGGVVTGLESQLSGLAGQLVRLVRGGLSLGDALAQLLVGCGAGLGFGLQALLEVFGPRVEIADEVVLVVESLAELVVLGLARLALGVDELRVDLHDHLGRRARARVPAAVLAAALAGGSRVAVRLRGRSALVLSVLELGLVLVVLGLVQDLAHAVAVRITLERARRDHVLAVAPADGALSGRRVAERILGIDVLLALRVRLAAAERLVGVGDERVDRAIAVLVDCVSQDFAGTGVHRRVVVVAVGLGCRRRLESVQLGAGHHSERLVLVDIDAQGRRRRGRGGRRNGNEKGRQNQELLHDHPPTRETH